MTAKPTYDTIKVPISALTSDLRVSRRGGTRVVDVKGECELLANRMTSATSIASELEHRAASSRASVRTTEPRSPRSRPLQPRTDQIDLQTHFICQRQPRLALRHTRPSWALIQEADLPVGGFSRATTNHPASIQLESAPSSAAASSRNQVRLESHTPRGTRASVTRDFPRV